MIQSRIYLQLLSALNNILMSEHKV